MNKLMHVLFLLATSSLLVACVDDGLYANEYYSSGYSYPTETTSGYNLTYHKRHRSTQTHSRPTPPAQANGGYSSSGNSPVSSGSYPVSSVRAVDNGGYASSAGTSVAAPTPPSPPAPPASPMSEPSKPVELESVPSHPSPDAASQAPSTSDDGGYSSSSQ